MQVQHQDAAVRKSSQEAAVSKHTCKHSERSGDLNIEHVGRVSDVNDKIQVLQQTDEGEVNTRGERGSGVMPDLFRVFNQQLNSYYTSLRWSVTQS